MNSGTYSHLPITVKDRPIVNTESRVNAKESMQDTKTQAASGPWHLPEVPLWSPCHLPRRGSALKVLLLDLKIKKK